MDSRLPRLQMCHQPTQIFSGLSFHYPATATHYELMRFAIFTHGGSMVGLSELASISLRDMSQNPIGRGEYFAGLISDCIEVGAMLELAEYRIGSDDFIAPEAPPARDLWHHSGISEFLFSVPEDAPATPPPASCPATPRSTTSVFHERPRMPGWTEAPRDLTGVRQRHALIDSPGASGLRGPRPFIPSSSSNQPLLAPPGSLTSPLPRRLQQHSPGYPSPLPVPPVGGPVGPIQSIQSMSSNQPLAPPEGPVTGRPPTKRARMAFTDDDDLVLMKHVFDHKHIRGMGGNGTNLWVEGARMGILPNRTAQSLQARYKKTIYPRLESEYLAKFRVYIGNPFATLK